MEIDIKKVLSVCPNASRSDIITDLKITGCADMTINRIFDGLISSSVQVIDLCDSDPEEELKSTFKSTLISKKFQFSSDEESLNIKTKFTSNNLSRIESSSDIQPSNSYKPVFNIDSSSIDDFEPSNKKRESDIIIPSLAKSAKRPSKAIHIMDSSPLKKTKSSPKKVNETFKEQVAILKQQEKVSLTNIGC